MSEDRLNRVNTILYCRRWEDVVEFYRDILGLAVHMKRDWFVEFQLSGGAFLSIADDSRAAVKTGSGAGITLSFKVSDVDTWRRRLDGQGIAVGPVRHHWGARAFFFHDPEGHRIEFWSKAPDEP